MSTTSITQRPIPMAAAGVAVAAAVALGALSLVQNQSGNDAPRSPVQQLGQTSSVHHDVATTSGGRILLGQ